MKDAYVRNPNPYKTAIELAEQHLTVKEYEDLQQQRLKRYKFFESIGQQYLTESAKDLHEWGEKVLNHLRGIYSNSN